MQKAKLNEAEKKHFQEEIEDWKVKILEKDHQVHNMSVQRLSIQVSIDAAIQTEKNKILAAKALIEDLRFDFKHQVTYKGLGAKIDEAQREIERHQKNIQAREKQIKDGLIPIESKDERARREIKEKQKKKAEATMAQPYIADPAEIPEDKK